MTMPDWIWLCFGFASKEIASSFRIQARAANTIEAIVIMPSLKHVREILCAKAKKDDD